MKSISIRPTEIIVPGEVDLADDTALRIYFDICNRGYPQAIAPVIVTKYNPNKLMQSKKAKLTQIAEASDRIYIGPFSMTKEDAIGRVEMMYEEFAEKSKIAPYYLIDGNHRSMAFTLTGNPISALNLEDDSDLNNVKQMSKQ